MLGGLLTLLGIGCIGKEIIKDAKVVDYGKVTGKFRDYRASSIDHAKVLRGELSQKEYNRRLHSSYYYTKDTL